MTRPAAQIEGALALKARGHSASSVARELHIPRSTVRDWLSGRVPIAKIPGVTDCTTCGNAIHDFAALGPSYAYLLGLYLGDGCISSHRRGVFRLRITLDSAYPRIIDEAAAAMKLAMPENKVSRFLRPSHDVEVSSFSKSWPCLFPQHGPGKKHLRRIQLSAWQEDLVRRNPEFLLRGLVHSDGCRFMNTGRAGWRHPRYLFTNLSSDIRTIFTNACDQLGLRWTRSGCKVYVSRKADVARMDGFIGPKA
ncbi:MAG: helix-turn-helix domain-containing protein [Actinomycetota bacterium]